MRKIRFLVVFAIFGLTGCVTGTRNLENLDIPNYENIKNSTGSIYIENIQDSRRFEQKSNSPATPSVDGSLSDTSKDKLSTLIGRQRNGYGAAMGDVALPEGVTVQDKVRELITEGLESRGYQVVDDKNAANKLSVDVEKFWAWFSPGFATISFESDLQCNMKLERPSGDLSFSVTGYGKNKGQVASNANWELAYKRAFTEFLQNFDELFDAKGL